ncbi:hypothetical protein [Streptomyces sp. NPDC059533]|uniref:hypothetical protein n=1 Tax=Streptomyces sp. NPDC059533 TaxID=3346858 RepID=UPI0036B84A63
MTVRNPSPRKAAELAERGAVVAVRRRRRLRSDRRRRLVPYGVAGTGRHPPREIPLVLVTRTG